MALTQEQLQFLVEMIYKTIGEPMLSIGQKVEEIKEYTQPFVDEKIQIEKIKEYCAENSLEMQEAQQNYDEKKQEAIEKQEEYDDEKDKIK